MTLDNDKMSNQMTPAELKAARKQLGLTQAQLAAELGVHQSTYAKWEAGTFKIAHPKILELALDMIYCRQPEQCLSLCDLS